MIAKRSFPFVPLFDLTDEICVVGAAVTRFQVGDRVFADNDKDGGGELISVDQALVSHMPKTGR